MEKLAINDTKWVLDRKYEDEQDYHPFEFVKTVSKGYNFPKEFNVTSAIHAERHASHYLKAIDEVTYDLIGAMEAVEIMKENPKQLTEFFELIARNEPNYKITSSEKKDHATEFQNLLKDFENIMRNKVNLDDAFWDILSNTKSWITGGIMAGEHNDIDIVCEPSTFMKVVDAIYEEYLNKPGYKIISSTQKNENRVIIEMSKEKKVIKLDIFQGFYTSFDTVANFHFGCVKALYNGTKFRCLPSYIVSMYTGIIWDVSNDIGNNFKRVGTKYVQRGFYYISDYNDWDYDNFTSKKFTTYPLTD